MGGSYCIQLLSKSLQKHKAVDNVKAKKTQLWTLGIGTPQPCLTLSKDGDVSFTSLSLPFISFTKKVNCVIATNTSTWRTDACKQTVYSNHYTKRASKTRKLQDSLVHCIFSYQWWRWMGSFKFLECFAQIKPVLVIYTWGQIFRLEEPICVLILIYLTFRYGYMTISILQDSNFKVFLIHEWG